MRERITYTCKYCKWHDDFTGACINGDSEHVADFTDMADTCDKWEKDNGE